MKSGFFACHSDDYSIVPNAEEGWTKRLCLRNIRFFKEGHLIPAPLANLKAANSMTITFEMQKNE